MIRTCVGYYNGNSIWDIIEGRFLMGTPHDQDYVPGYYYIMYDTNNLHYIINAVKYNPSEPDLFFWVQNKIKNI